MCYSEDTSSVNLAPAIPACPPHPTSALQCRMKEADAFQDNESVNEDRRRHGKRWRVKTEFRRIWTWSAQGNCVVEASWLCAY